ncbi:MAG TPA: hypothetical protein VMW94_04370 [Actinomycetes bacterium]|nr:hypothetical protein [Actinomycetes bacterium]
MIFENTTRWSTAGLRAFVDAALEQAIMDNQPIQMQTDTLVIAKHSSMRDDMVRAGRMSDSNSMTLRLLTPERAGVDVVSALGAIAGGTGAMPAKMRAQLWSACLDMVRHQAWSHGKAPKIPASLPGVSTMKSRGLAPVALERKLAEQIALVGKLAGDLAVAEKRILATKTKLAKERKSALT